MEDQFLVDDGFSFGALVSTPPTPLSGLTVTASKNSNGGIIFAFSNGSEVVSTGPDVTMNLDAVISPDPSDDWILLDAVSFAIAHTRLDTNTEQGKLALMHMQSEVAQLYIKVQLSNETFQLPNVPGMGEQGSMVSWQLSDLLYRTTWVVNDNSGQPGGVGRNVELPDGTFESHFTAQGFESYYGAGDTATNFILLHELAHETPQGLGAQAFFNHEYVQRTGDNTYANYGPNDNEWLNREVYANLVAQEFATELGLGIISAPTHGYIFY